LNNLAWLLAHRKDRAEEALALLKRAIEAAGPHGAFLDTRAVVCLTLGKSEPALKDVEQALDEAPTAARYLHQARAYLLAHNAGAAEIALRKARTAGLRPDNVHALEREAYEALVQSLEPS
jgi:tetratricopeptide (TPR) repeat protein